MSPNAYSFLPWLRAGIATKITKAPVAPATRADFLAKLILHGDPLQGTQQIDRPVQQPIQLYGPGDVIGVDPRAICRTEPRPWITNVEPNYLAHIEFYEEDFLWTYSPAVPDDNGRLLPWLALIVLEGPNEAGDPGEFVEGSLPGRPLPYITVTNPAATLPRADQLGAWAHVHVNGELDDRILSDEQSMPAVLSQLRQVLRNNPDQACARLICPRHLQPNRPYHAFLVPTFETGRLAGLGFPPVVPNAQGPLYSSWGPNYQGRQGVGQLPYYHRWFFATGAAGDFEYLVRLLKPRKPDDRVARRDFDVQRKAGPGLPPITTPAGLGGVLRLGGALRIPDRKQDLWDNWDGRFPAPPPPPPPPPPYPHPFQEALAGLVNLADDYLEHTPAAAHANLAGAPELRFLADEVDPVITPPLYGKWHAQTSRLLHERDGTRIPAPRNKNWVHRLNLDPRFRIAANFGTQVVQARQEEFMAAAWAQVGDVLEANNRIRAAQLAREVGHVLQRKHLSPPAASADSAAAPAPSGRALRLTAPAGPRVTPSTGAAALTAGLQELGESLAVGFQVAASQVSAAPVSPEMRRIMRPGSPLMRTLFSAAEPDDLVPKMDRATGAVTAAAPKKTPAAVVTPEQLDGILHPRPLGLAEDDPVDRLATSSHFVLSVPDEHIVPPTGGDDSREAQLFKDGLRDIYRGWDDAAVGGRTPERPLLGVAAATGQMLDGLRADETVPKSLLASVRLLSERLEPFANRFIPVMAYPVIDLPMFQALIDLSADTFVPNLNLVPPNSITLLETDQEFIEAFMVGLNHEMARELLWREFPTDQRGTPFRQFWDPRPAPALPGEPPEVRKERLYDITRIAEWAPDTELGTHDNRDVGQTQENELVLVIRGELLKKYPTAAVYAHKADWARDEQGVPHPELERVLADFPDLEHPPTDLVRLPIYEAKVDPDITLLGFDLTSKAARGHVPDDPGWFFVLKERPGDPRFGVDEGQEETPVEVWNDLSWKDVDPHDRRFIELDPAVTVPLVPFDGSEDDPEKQEQRREDIALPLWNARLSSADIAYMLFQAPVLIAVHAQEMLIDAAQ
ncbi:hypothetical protein [Streptomyces sp. NRRL S-646]|uniref:hypothetical protein n=1 Tax=Streptomyces sp. NRRL S-646 TaxID=1463917 RepID=UPI0004C52CEE|nr:hypothetical protein [Streptomyces sp. NRRL S-646]